MNLNYQMADTVEVNSVLYIEFKIFFIISQFALKIWAGSASWSGTMKIRCWNRIWNKSFRIHNTVCNTKYWPYLTTPCEWWNMSYLWLHLFKSTVKTSFKELAAAIFLSNENHYFNINILFTFYDRLYYTTVLLLLCSSIET